jgi:quercetin dioxygenase-like cupin family protein
MRTRVVDMLMPGQAHIVEPGAGRSVDLGVVSMRVIAAGEGTTGRNFTLAEFYGSGSGPWTVPHLHRGFEESFFVLDGRFTFTVGDEEREATPGTYILVPRGTAHTIRAAEGGGRFLTLMVPGGLEEMFFELGQLPPNAIRDPEARAAISARYDSIPVQL